MKRILIILLITACCLRAGSDSPIESIQALKEKSASGDHAAQYQLALEYVSGKRIQRNEPAAFELFLKSAKKGNAKAEYKVALAYFNGEGVLKNQVEGLAWMYRAIEAGISDLQISSMKAVLNEADINNAQKMANDSKPIFRGNNLPQPTTANSYPYNNSAKFYSDPSFTLNNLDKAVSVYNDGIAFYKGKDVPQHFGRAFECFQKSAQFGYSKAQYALAFCYYKAEGVAKDDVEAAKWFRKSAEQGDAKAQVFLGVLYANGYGVTKDEVEAVKWFRKSAEQGNALAQVNLGKCYKSGTGVAKDDVEAVKWYRKAADQGDAKAQVFLGVTYSNGNGVPMNEVEAVKWYRKAVEQGDAKSQYNLGDCYANGQGVAKDEVEAYALYTLAGRSLEVARKTRFFLKKGMTSMQVAKGERRANELQSQISARISKPASE